MAHAAPPPDPARNANTTRNATVLVAVILSGAAMTWMAPILTPLALAVFLMLMIDAMARDLHGRLPRLGPDASLVAAIATCILVFAVVVYFIAGHAAGFVGKLMAYSRGSTRCWWRSRTACACACRAPWRS
ncbi:MAG: hypothetical protein WDM85_17660 [Caulobacteraceae bacterium]